ncbi:acetyltransferase-like protein [Phaeosphaeria sp. MPI-PUGE-AT-0046c]|nr:acetyltransferase-like protein [Phaeosphaeria sp. MPI-PUGE-AT-0046c]
MHACYLKLTCFPAVLAKPHASQPIMSSSPWTISSIAPASYDQVLSFIAFARRCMFPNHTLTPDTSSLLTNPGSSFFTAQSSDGTLIGVIGYVPYDFRFPHYSFQASYHALRTVEIVRLFVVPEWRGKGVAGALWDALDEEAKGRSVQCMYLHTHPFLEDAERFWDRRGFGAVLREEDEVWKTVHMERRLEGGGKEV